MACRRDNLPYRRCRLRVRYRDLSPGTHTFTLRLRHHGRTTYARRRWTVLPRRDREPPGRIPDRSRPPLQ
ncbi:MAG TPA: hypothetical protein VGV67_10620, partial [Solirubrobacteraceae bacterium]|nr:hypothetical protein [Solirubrobacteraceae bacterium]